MWYLNDGHFTPAVIAVSLAAPAVIYFLFERGLKVLMPAGALFS